MANDESKAEDREVQAKNRDNGVSTEKKLDELYALIDGIEVCMFTTRRGDGRLVSRPMQVQERRTGTDLWFVTDIETHKLDELVSDPQVNLAFYRDRTREWVSVSGRAMVTQDRQLVEGMYKPDWKAWFPKQDEQRDGSPRDPRIALILVEAESVSYMKSDRPRPLVLFEIVKAIVTGSAPKVGAERQLGEREIAKAARLEREG
jgi:general stress protein 26